ncbi:MAG: hypothetical protein JGK17_28570 [Microcoleus sp. PH2017_10_PVI_O_A]|uniref:hypothetical protein n=1 Tax=unclassified Microcoleus TaxID=2642155 RepID=UPI001D444C3B|nr:MULTISPECIES: hypothetical protein [unclassified Microcoleus]MCC3409438.1 hypothetical protein [Microcoleus sp. PH2017_10_PVI_O_A]MCC3463691.1 hypothetical protein [Microcoleus sp. PH2017_11_PCY_U_A]MCC3482054.1 hypothetical protein [Microcoleus sp. PH2017_12_PCY_D_A]MCC3531925.1 hypothetical protein [Microcoleus sp. PH2017_21_RUC_O_A]MCC3544250.1 hypothetical protein [Microcoleus sp. PH2017_22_RUC_O_B]
MFVSRSGDRPHTLSSDNSFDEEFWVTISKIRPASDLSGKMPIILAAQLASNNPFSRLIRLQSSSESSGRLHQSAQFASAPAKPPQLSRFVALNPS